ncbi:MAG: hypothetical protein JWP12_2737 [Bacteroidetes bacterium]|nr:hypothetical protein [Bacteroidota bacterium]
MDFSKSLCDFNLRNNLCNKKSVNLWLTFYPEYRISSCPTFNPVFSIAILSTM